MKIIYIVLKEFKQNMRDFKANTMMVLFPIVLIVILGAAFSNQFAKSITLDDAVVLYKIDVSGNAQLEEGFDGLRKQLTDGLGIIFEQAGDAEAARKDIADHKYTAFVHVTDNPLKMYLYKNERNSFNATLVENVLNSFIKTTSAMTVIAQNNPAAYRLPELQEQDDHVEVRSLDRKRQPGSTDYYAISMLTLILLYSSLTGLWGIRGEIEEKTAGRIMCAPVRDYQFMAGKVIGCIIVTLLQGLAVILFSKWVLNAYWGNDMLPVALLIVSYSVMAVSLGVALAYLMKSGEAASGVLNTIIPVLVFLGGGYVPISVMGSTIRNIAVVSPVGWINSALFEIIYEGEYSAAFISAGVNLGLAALFIATSALLSGRRNRANA